MSCTYYSGKMRLRLPSRRVRGGRRATLLLTAQTVGFENGAGLPGCGGARMFFVQEHGQLRAELAVVGRHGLFEQPALQRIGQMAPNPDHRLA